MLQQKKRLETSLEIIIAKKVNRQDCKCRECSYPSCHDPVWNESYCQYHYNEEHYTSR